MKFFEDFDQLVLFFKQKTAYDLRISDWSSDVCSSDLRNFRCPQRNARCQRHREWQGHLRGLNVLRVPVGQTPLNDLRDADICAFDIIAGETMLAAQIEHGLDRGMNPRGDRKSTRLNYSH